MYVSLRSWSFWILLASAAPAPRGTDCPEMIEPEHVLYFLHADIVSGIILS